MTRFGEGCKITKPSSGLSMLLSKEQHTMDGLPSIPCVLGCTSKVSQVWNTIETHGCCPFNPWAPKLWDQRIWWELQNNHAILRLVFVVTWITICHGWVATHFTCLVGALTRSYKPGAYSTYYDPVHLSIRAPKQWDQILWELQKHQGENYKTTMDYP